MPTPTFSIVVPLYNEEACVRRSVQELHAALERAFAGRYELLLVINGSTDRTGAICEVLAQSCAGITLVREPNNLGYGGGILAGLSRARGMYCGFTCGDGQASPEVLVELMRELERGGCDLVKITRVRRQDGFARALQSAVYNRLFRRLFQVPYRDINAMPKLMRTAVYHQLAIRSTDWFIDAELMIKAHYAGLRIKEVPAAHRPRLGGRSAVRFGTGVEFLRNAFRVLASGTVQEWKRLGLTPLPGGQAIGSLQGSAVAAMAPPAALRGKRVLVTGGTGFLGSHLVRALLRAGAQVSVMIRPTANLARLADDLAALQLVRASLSDRAEVLSEVRRLRPHVVFHLAAAGVAQGSADVTDIVTTNVLGLRHLLDALADVPCERFINTGSCFEYGDQREPLTEDAPLHPLNEYAASKTMAWHLCQLHRRRHGAPIVTLRPFTCFGPWEREDRLIPSTIRAALEGREIRITEGRQTRDYTYVEDMVQAFLLAAVKEEAVGHTFNLGTGADRTVLEIVERIRQLLGSRAPIRTGAVPARADDMARLCCDASRAGAILGWRPAVSFDAGIQRTAEWMRERRRDAGEDARAASGHVVWRG